MSPVIYTEIRKSQKSMKDLLYTASKTDSQMTGFHITFKIFYLLISEMQLRQKFSQ